MDEVDKKILNEIQKGFPVVPKPFEKIGQMVGISGPEAMERVKKLKEAGLIRRIGPVLESKKIGYVSTLCGVRVGESFIEQVAEAVNEHPGVTHNYQRRGELNLWFTITAGTQDEIDRFLEGLEKRFSLKICKFPEKRVFKIRTFFQIE